MLLSITLADIKDWIELLAAIITVLAGIGGAASIWHVFKNRFNKKTFRAVFQVGRIDDNWGNGYTFVCSLRFENRTNKAFSIIDCAIIHKNQICPMVEHEKRYSPVRMTIPIPIKDLSVESHDSITFPVVYFDIETFDNSPAKLRVRTTLGTLNYDIKLEKKTSLPDKAKRSKKQA